MTSDQHKAILDWATEQISTEDLTRRLGVTEHDLPKLAPRVLEKAYREQSGLEVEMGFYLGFGLGFGPDPVDLLSRLLDADWHQSHENVIGVLDKLRDRRSIESLYRAALKLHPYLEYERDYRAFSRKATFALGNLKDPAADEKLRLLAEADDPRVREHAWEQLEFRRNHG